MAASFPSYQVLLHSMAHLRLFSHIWTIGSVSCRTSYLQSPKGCIFAPRFLGFHPPQRQQKETTAITPTKLCLSEMQNNQLAVVSVSEFPWLPSTCLPNFKVSRSRSAGPSSQTFSPSCHSSRTSEAAPALTSHTSLHPSFPQGVWKERPLFPWRKDQLVRRDRADSNIWQIRGSGQGPEAMKQIL